MSISQSYVETMPLNNSNKRGKNKKSVYFQFVEHWTARDRDECQFRQMARVFVPHLIILTILISYLLFGALCYQLIDEKLASFRYTEIVLFCFNTISTIGYGNICPSNSASMIFTIFYSVFGIPLCMLTIVNFGKYVTKAYWILMICLGRKLPRSPFGEAKLPFLAVFFMFFVIQIFTIIILDKKSFSMADFYFSVVSFSTIGYGDMYATAGSPLRLIAVIFYLTWGIIIVGLWFTFIKEQMRKIYYFRRRFRGARDVQVWFGERHLKVGQVLEIIAREFKASPNQVHQVLNDLDYLISEAIAEHNQKRNPSVSTDERHSLEFAYPPCKN